MTALQKNAQENLKRLVDQIERLEGEKRDICDDIKDKFAEAKSSGFDVKVLRRLLKLRKQSKEDPQCSAQRHLWPPLKARIATNPIPTTRIVPIPIPPAPAPRLNPEAAA